MTQSALFTGSIWAITLALAVGTFSFRLSFIQLQVWIDELPPSIENALTFIPPAILAALVFPELFVLDGSLLGMVLDERVLAGGLAAAVAWRTGNMIATIGTGMVVLWTAQFLFG